MSRTGADVSAVSAFLTKVTSRVVWITAACTSPKTAARWLLCSRSSCRHGRSKCSRSRWSVTRWAVWWRSACHQADQQGRKWVRHVRHVVSLGTPHLGAPLEQGAHLAAAALQKLPETRLLSRFLRRRSAGIRDLRHGSLVDEYWRDRDSEAQGAVACREVPLLPWATHFFVSATVTRDPNHPLGRLLGDIPVLKPSASGQGKARRSPSARSTDIMWGPHHIAAAQPPRGPRAPPRLAGNGARGGRDSRVTARGSESAPAETAGRGARSHETAVLRPRRSGGFSG